MDSSSPKDRFAELIRKDPRFHPEAYGFVFEALDFTVRKVHGTNRSPEGLANHHVTGQDLLEGIRRHALDHFGCLAAVVFEFWGINSSGHFGDIVFNLVDHGLMGKQDSDKKEDFSCGYGGRSFDEVFRVNPIFEYNREKDEWKASYLDVLKS